jgi:hypothetical protein
MNHTCYTSNGNQRWNASCGTAGRTTSSNPAAAAQLRNLPLGSEVRLTTFAQYYNDDTKDPYS